MKKVAVVVVLLQLALGAPAREFSVVEATIAEMQTAMREGRTTSRGVVQQYLQRIAKHEERLNAIITLNPRALDEADARDRERAQGRLRGPLHGIPIALKDNIHTTDMPTTGGALAFKGFVPPYEATITTHLRNAGAIIIATTTCPRVPNSDYTRFLNPRGLAGRRIGVPRGTFVDEPRHGQVLREAIAVLQQHGATVIDPLETIAQPRRRCHQIRADAAGYFRRGESRARSRSLSSRSRDRPPFPSGFAAKPAPLGISLTGGACSEPRLIELAYAFEQATRRRTPPVEFP